MCSARAFAAEIPFELVDTHVNDPAFADLVAERYLALALRLALYFLTAMPADLRRAKILERHPARWRRLDRRARARLRRLHDHGAQGSRAARR